MNCEVIQDLIPLYADNCCSAESRVLVEEHAKHCDICGQLLEAARRPIEQAAVPAQPRWKLNKVSVWKASVLQSVLFLVYFAIITFGVAQEAATPTGLANGFWALYAVAPATGFLLSLINWYFVRLYRSRRAFTVWSVVAAAFATLCCVAWCFWHYQWSLSIAVILHLIKVGLYGYGIVFFSVVNLALAAVLSYRYAGLVGKE